MLHLKALTPFIKLYDKNNIEIFEQLEALTKEENVNNIGILGPNGAGKTSFIESYFQWRKEKCNDKDNILHLSLVNLNDNSKITDKDKKELQTRQIEDCILKQILYSESSSKLPKSNYQNIPSNKKTLIIPLLIIILSFFLISIFSFNYIQSFKKEFTINNHISAENVYVTNDTEIHVKSELSNSQFNFTELPVFVRLSIPICIISFLISLGALFYLINILDINIKKISIRSNDIEFNNLIKTPFSVYLSEIIYFFTQTNKNIVLIEDIDRFKNETIFLHLKELNFIINHYPDIKQKVKFIYLLDDSLFQMENKTKFFDLVIPIISIANKFNMGNKMISYKKEIIKNNLFPDVSFLKELEDEYLIKIGKYINEYRLMLNIWNEFSIYCLKLNSNPFFGPKNIFTYVFLNNTHPQINKLLVGENSIFNLFMNRKNGFVEKKREQLNKEINELYAELEHEHEEIQESISEEFCELYIKKYRSDLSFQQVKSEIESRNLQFISLMEGKSILNFYEPIKEPLIINIHLRDMLKNDDQLSFRESMGQSTSGSFLLEPLEEKENENHSLINVNFSTLVKLYPEEFSLDYILLNEDKLNKTNNLKLIFEFMKDGLIDEYYILTTNIFYEGILNSNDEKFIKALKESKPLNSDIKIYDPQSVINYIVQDDYTSISKEYNTNYYILDYLLYNSMNVICKRICDSYLKLFTNEKFAEFFDWYDNQNQKSRKIEIINSLTMFYFNFLDNKFYSFNPERKNKFVDDFLLSQLNSKIFISRNSNLYKSAHEKFKNWNNEKQNYDLKKQHLIDTALKNMKIQ